MRYKVYVDYTTEENSRPFYVGKGSDHRVKLIKRNKLHTAIAAKYGLDRRVIFETDDELIAFDKERELIVEHNTYIYAGGWGANFTLGGEGGSGAKFPDRHGENHPMWGRKHSEESKRKNSESNKLATSGEKNGMFGKHHNEETRKKIGDRSRCRIDSDETRQKKSLAAKRINLGRKHTSLTRQRMSEAAKGRTPWNKGKKFGKRVVPRVFSEQARKNIAEAAKRRYYKQTEHLIDSIDVDTLASKIL
jgi:hypothetical protein